MRHYLKSTCSAALLAASLCTATTAFAQMLPPSISSEATTFEQDREAILSMAGDYRVRFDMQEATAWLEGYEPIDPKISGGYESVRVIEDTGTTIVLQHLLVVGAEGEEFVIKHWRQDWEYEPGQVLAYEGPDHWVLTDVSEADRAGSWAQTVYQVDDSPRYAGVGTWEVANGIRRWTSDWTARPLARRDAVRDPIYDRYASINRHEITPTGWIHWQDNTKMMPSAAQQGALVPVVQEYVLNTYNRFEDYNVSAADAYWAATSGYWAAVRDLWAQTAAAHGGITIEEEAQTGTVISGRLLEIANEIHSGELSEEDAVAQARDLIREATGPSA